MPGIQMEFKFDVSLDWVLGAEGMPTADEKLLALAAHTLYGHSALGHEAPKRVAIDRKWRRSVRENALSFHSGLERAKHIVHGIEGWRAGSGKAGHDNGKNLNARCFHHLRPSFENNHGVAKVEW